MLRSFKNIQREDLLLYILFFAQTFGRHVEPFAILGWILLQGQFKDSLKSMVKLLPLFLYLIISSLIGFAITSFPMNMFVEQIAQLIVYMSIYYAMMTYYQGRFDHIFSIYSNVALILAISAILQYFFGRFLGIDFLMSVSNREVIIGDFMRARAWMGEPSYMAQYLIPAIVYESLKFGIERPRALIMILAGILAFSPVFKFVLVLFLVYYFVAGKYPKRKIILYALAGLAINYAVNTYTISDYDMDKTKKNETIENLNASFSQIERTNLSTYAMLKNIKIACMADNRLTGTGLGSHGYSHDKYYHSCFYYSFLNKNDAFSLGTRLFSELGIVGLALFILFFIYGFNKQNYINVSVIFYIIYALCRGGHYTIFGLQFFIMIFYFTSKYKSNYGVINNYTSA